MGHNITPRKRSAKALRAPLTDFRGWRLAVDCGAPACPRSRVFDVRQLAAMYRDLTVGDVLRRLRCEGCACSPASAILQPGPELRGVRVEAVALVGRGAV